jgi:PleD family two-component response regulator
MLREPCVCDTSPADVRTCRSVPPALTISALCVFDDLPDDPAPPVALLVSDHPWDARALESALAARGYACAHARDARTAALLAAASRVDVVLASTRLPDATGEELCRRLRRDAMLSPVVPVVLVTSDVPSRADRAAALRAGAWDLCAYPVDVELLLLRLDVWLPAKRHADRAHGAALVDEPTGLYTLRGLVRRAREMSAEAQRQGGPIACVAFAFGATDAAAARRIDALRLRETCRRIGRASDAFGRLGDAEFAVVATTGAAGATRLAERLRDGFGDVSGPTSLRLAAVAVDDYAAGTLDVLEMLRRATTGLRPSAGGLAELRAGVPAV